MTHREKLVLIDKSMNGEFRFASRENKYSVTTVNTQFENYLVCIGKTDIDIRIIGHLKGVKDIHRVSDNYKLVSRKWNTGLPSWPARRLLLLRSRPNLF